jgi:transcriptional regulator with XRE-family HTH domain
MFGSITGEGLNHEARDPLRLDVRKLVSRNFARLRRKKALTQEEVEARSGFSQQYLSSLELGCRNQTVVTPYELAQALGMSHVELVELDERNK